MAGLARSGEAAHAAGCDTSPHRQRAGKRSDRMDGVDMGDDEDRRAVIVRARMKDGTIAEPVAARNALDPDRLAFHLGEDHVLHCVDRRGVVGGAFERQPLTERGNRQFF